MRIVFVTSDDHPEGSLRLILQEAGHYVVRLVVPAGAILELPSQSIGANTDLILLESSLSTENRSRFSNALRSSGYHGPVLFVRERCEDSASLHTFATLPGDELDPPRQVTI